MEKGDETELELGLSEDIFNVLVAVTRKIDNSIGVCVEYGDNGDYLEGRSLE